MTTYQRLKAENQKLRQELDKVCNEPESFGGIEIRMKYKLNRAAEIAVWGGSTSVGGGPFYGVLKSIVK